MEAPTQSSNFVPLPLLRLLLGFLKHQIEQCMYLVHIWPLSELMGEAVNGDFSEPYSTLYYEQTSHGNSFQ